MKTEKLKITVIEPTTKNTIVYEALSTSKTISCPICGRWYANYYLRTHLYSIHNKMILKVEQENKEG
ncbi:MAG: hypothetical protein QXS21_05495 [Thermoproteota archaeon]